MIIKKMPQDRYILGLDIGSSKITACLCLVRSEEEVHVLSTVHLPAMGLTKGKIEHPDELKRSIRKAIQRVELSAGVCADHIITTLPSYGVSTRHRMGNKTLEDPYLPITAADRLACLKNAKEQDMSINETLLHLIPLQFSLDEQIVDNPIGHKGQLLSVQTHVIRIKSHIVETVSGILSGLSLHISGILFDPLPTGHIYLSESQKETGAYILDMGGRFTKLSFFQNNLLQTSVIIPLGGDTITQDIAQCLKMPFMDAERLKILYGDLHFSKFDPQEKVKKSPAEAVEINRRMLCQIIEARVAEIILLLQKQTSLHFSPEHSVVFVGGCSKLNGLKDYLQDTFNHPVSFGIPYGFDTLDQAVDHATSLGCVLYALSQKAISFPKPPAKDLFKRLNQWIRDFI